LRFPAVNWSRLALVAGALTLTGLIPGALSAFAASKSIVVVRQQDDKNSKRLIRGIKSTFKRSNQNAVIDIITISTLSNGNRSLFDSLRLLNPSIIVPLGSHITTLISDSIHDAPLVFGAVIQPESSGFIKSKEHPGGNITGASLDISPALQFKYFKQIYPNLHKLGIIYSDETARIIPHAKVVAKAAGIELYALKVEQRAGRANGRAVKKALDSLLQVVDGLWSLADPAIFSRVSTKLLVRQTIANKVPFMGFSSTVVASGALFALDFDYKDIGRQVGELCERVLSGESPGALPVTSPDIVWFHYNEITSSRIAVSIPEELRAVAKEVYK